MREAHARVAELYRRHAASVYRRACTLLGNEAEAREVLQDLFVSLLERPEQFSGGSTVTTFLYSATTHACLNRLRNHKNRLRLLEAQGELHSHAVQDVHALIHVREVLRQMPEELAQVAVYYFVDGLSHGEIAELLGCSRRRVGDLVERVEAWGSTQEGACSLG
jgi:RNA polymerase sigma-70 factor (ECF subfamily)